MADSLRQLIRQVDTLTSAVQSPPVHIGGNSFEFRWDPSVASTATPPAVTLQVSHDKLNWNTAHRAGAAATTGTQIDDAVDSGYEAVLERPKWARFQVAGNAEAARTYQGVFIIHKEE